MQIMYRLFSEFNLVKAIKLSSNSKMSASQLQELLCSLTVCAYGPSRKHREDIRVKLGSRNVSSLSSVQTSKTSISQQDKGGSYYVHWEYSSIVQMPFN